MKHSPFFLPVWLAMGALLLVPAPTNLDAQTTQAAPNLTPVRPRLAGDAPGDDSGPDLSLPVATVNGVAVYRPLMRSIVSNPVDRALLIVAYRQSGMSMSASDKDFIAKQLELTQFQGSDKRLDAKLHALNATRDDYKQFAVEEAKLRDVLRFITHDARSPRQAEQQKAEYIAQLRKDASINTARP